MPSFKTPGVYRRPLPTADRGVRRVRTDVAGFVGVAERGPLPLKPEYAYDSSTACFRDPEPPWERGSAVVRLTSWSEYLATFGGHTAHAYLSYAVRGFFENGGTLCHVLRIAATQHADELERPCASVLALPSSAAPAAQAALRAPAGAGERALILDAALGAVRGDLVEIQEPGITERHTVASTPPEGSEQRLELAGALRSSFAEGAVVRKLEVGLKVWASSPGNWGDRLSIRVEPLELGEEFREFALRVRLEPGLDRSIGPLEESYRRLRIDDPDSDDFAPRVVNGSSNFIRMLVPSQWAGTPQSAGGQAKCPADFQPYPLSSAYPVGVRAISLEGGRDGLSGLTAADFVGGADDQRGLRLLEDVDEIAILCAPDAVFQAFPVVAAPPAAPADRCLEPVPPSPPDPIFGDPTAEPAALDESATLQIQRAMVEQCEHLRDRVCILDPPGELKPSAVVEWRSKTSSPFGSLYYPWLDVPDTLALGVSRGRRRVPPSGHVAGVYARTDHELGVHSPPANAALRFVVDVAYRVGDVDQELLNPESVNALRPFPGRGLLVWGARSLASKAASDWRFIHVRRLMSMIEESVDESMQWTVFEPHDANLRATLQHSLSVFLEGIWRAGGLKGERAEDAFYVRCDETNNPVAAVSSGQLLCQIGVAVTAPMEFIEFQVRRQVGEQAAQPS